LRVPAVIRWPGQLFAGVASEQVTIGMDWFPTLLAAAGAAPDPAFPPDGIDLLPLLTQASAPLPRKLFWRYKLHGQRAMRDGAGNTSRSWIMRFCSTWPQGRL